LLGIFYYQRERYDEAEAALNQAKTLTPDNDMVHRNLGGVYRMHGRYQDAIRELQQSLKIHSTAVAYASLGGAYFYAHRFQEAVTAEESAIDLNANDYRYWGNLASYAKWAPGNEGKIKPALNRAIELALKTLDAQPMDLSIHANLAEYRSRLGDSRGALKEIEAIPAQSRSPFMTRFAIAYELTGHRDRAIELLRSTLKNRASLNQIKDDPDLAGLWRDPEFQKAVGGTR